MLRLYLKDQGNLLKSLSKRRRTLPLLVAGFVVLCLIVFVWLPLQERQTTIDDSIAQKREELRRFQTLLGQRETYLKHLSDLDQAVEEFEKGLLETVEDRSGQSMVEEMVRLLAAENGVRVIRSNPLADSKVGDRFAKVGLQVNLESDLADLVNFLHALSSHPTFLFVDEFNLSGTRGRDPTRIRPRMRISGFVRLS